MNEARCSVAGREHDGLHVVDVGSLDYERACEADLDVGLCVHVPAAVVGSKEVSQYEMPAKVLAQC